MSMRQDHRTSAALLTLALEVQRLAPSHRDPEAFHIAKSEIVHRLRKLARGDTPSKDAKSADVRPLGKTQVQLVYIRGC
jgi:hypothetical protein